MFQTIVLASLGKRAAKHLLKTSNKTTLNCVERSSFSTLAKNNIISLRIVQSSSALSSQQKRFFILNLNISKRRVITYLDKWCRCKSYYGEPAEFNAAESQILLYNDETTSKWKQIPPNCIYQIFIFKFNLFSYLIFYLTWKLNK